MSPSPEPEPEPEPEPVGAPIVSGAHDRSCGHTLLFNALARSSHVWTVSNAE